jgi:hypothetical protein
LPWLERADDTVSDFCGVGAARFTHRVRRRKLVLCRGPRPMVTCWREVTVGYGFVGSRAERLTELIAVLEDDGWADWKHRFAAQKITHAWLVAAGHDNSLRASWRYRPGLEPPPVLQDDDPELHFSHKPTPGLRLRWMSFPSPMHRPRHSPEMTGPSFPQGATGRGRSTQNNDARTPPGRLRKQLLPVMW